MKPKLLDLYCGAGLAAKGYQDAGFEVLGVDIEKQPNYPGQFVESDALEFMLTYGPGLRAMGFVVIHTSPPCQASSALTKGTNQGMVYKQMIPQTRDALEQVGLPWVIENVAGAPIRKDLTLCGEMFGLGVIRHRFFEFGGGLAVPEQPTHVKHRGRVAGMRHGVWYEGPYFAVYGEGGGKGTVAQWQQAMGVTHTSVRKEIAEGIPPLFARFIGEHMMKELT